MESLTIFFVVLFSRFSHLIWDWYTIK